MIISHKNKFIFVKTRKTASTSIEIALSQFCGPDDIITPITPEDEFLRKKLGFRGPQNYKSSVNVFQRKQNKAFNNHASVQFIKQIIGDDIWNKYFKFCFERNPFDRAISRYYWSTRDLEIRPAISDFLKSIPAPLLSNWNIYTINNEISVDFVGRYETLAADLKKIRKIINLPDFSLPFAKANYRRDNLHYSEVLSMKDRDLIKKICTKEIAVFKYHWRKED